MHSVAKKFIVSMNLPRRRTDETNEAEEEATQQVKDHDNDNEADASQIELDEFQSKLARMVIYLYNSVKTASKWYVFKNNFTSKFRNDMYCGK